jgi:ribosomal protein S18 acetylase RimI-like enzyme
LAEIGVSSAARGFGVGTLLLEHRLELIDHTRDAAYLESSTERNRALYRRHGFVELGIIEGLPSGAPMAMWRPRR